MKNHNEIKTKLNKSISFGSLKSYDKTKENDIDEIFDLSCLFLTNRKINECYNNFGNKLKKLGYTFSQKNNIINCNKNGYSYQVSIIKLNNNFNITDKYTDDKSSVICFKIYDRKKNNKNNKFNEIFFKNNF